MRSKIYSNELEYSNLPLSVDWDNTHYYKFISNELEEDYVTCEAFNYKETVLTYKNLIVALTSIYLSHRLVGKLNAFDSPLILTLDFIIMYKYDP